MLILKGDKGKSRFLCDITGNNLCFQYYDHSINLGGYYMSRLNHSIEEFKDYIEACLYEEDKSDKENLYDYLIIYTNENENENEEDLKDFISWLKDNERWFLCRDVILTCI